MSSTREELLEAGFEEVCGIDEIPQMMPRKVHTGGRNVLLCKDDAQVYAVDEICPHKDKSMAYGVVHHGKITCPHHQYDFELATGRCNRRKCAPVMTYSVEVVDDSVFVKIG